MGVCRTGVIRRYHRLPSLAFPALAAILTYHSLPGPALAEDRLGLQAGDRVVIAGNAFAERMAYYGYLETVLHCAYPGHRLTVRNLGWSGDEVDLMPRPRNFGTFEEHLAWHRADVVFLCYGLNESFAGEPGLVRWTQRLTSFVRSLKGKPFNGEFPPKLILVSPVAHEDLGHPFPTGKEVRDRNNALARYCGVMQDVAVAEGLLYVDLATPTYHLSKLADAPEITINGIHLNETGYYIASQMVARALGIIDRPFGGDPADDSAAEKLRRLIYEKNHLYFLSWRPVNPYYIWGGRAWCWHEAAPMVELEQIGATVRKLDEQIWSAEKPDPAEVWAHLPGGKEMWETPVDHSKFEFASEPPQMATVRRNGALEKGEN